MTPAEAAELLAHAAAFDSRTVGIIDARAWAAALHDIPLDPDTLDAVAAYYGSLTPNTDRYDPTRRRWLEAHHVRHHRQQIRNARITAANAVYDGRPDESVDDYLRNIRALTAAAASGRLGPQTATAALEPGAPAVDADGRGRAMLQAVGRDVLSRRPEFAAACPRCGAERGRPCRNARNPRLRDAHPSRIEASRLVNTGQAPVTRADTTLEEQRRVAAARSALAATSGAVEPEDDFDPRYRTKQAAAEAAAQAETAQATTSEAS